MYRAFLLINMVPAVTNWSAWGGPREEDHPFSTRFLSVPLPGNRENPFGRSRLCLGRGNARELRQRSVHEIGGNGGKHMPKQFNVLIVSASVEDRKALLHVLESLSTNVISCSNLAQAGEVLSQQTIGLSFLRRPSARWNLSRLADSKTNRTEIAMLRGDYPRRRMGRISGSNATGCLRCHSHPTACDGRRIDRHPGDAP